MKKIIWCFLSIFFITLTSISCDNDNNQITLTFMIRNSTNKDAFGYTFKGSPIYRVTLEGVETKSVLFDKYIDIVIGEEKWFSVILSKSTFDEPLNKILKVYVKDDIGNNGIGPVYYAWANCDPREYRNYEEHYAVLNGTPHLRELNP